MVAEECVRWPSFGRMDPKKLKPTTMNYFSILAASCCGISLVFGLSPTEIETQREGLKEWHAVAGQAFSLPREDAFKKLAEGIRKTSREDIYSIDGTNEVHQELLKVLIGIHGHAEYSRDRVLAAQAAHRDDVTSNEAGSKYNDYLTERGVLITTLSQLPSVETVNVLGEFLSDEWIHPESSSWPVDERIGPMSIVAVRTFSKLPLANKPADTRYDHEAKEHLQSWKLWYEQIKAGTRTFRFEGDPQEYDLNGPASAEKLRKIEQSRIRDEKRATGLGKTELKGSETTKGDELIGFPVAGLVSGLLVCAAAAWYFVRRKKNV